MRSDLLKLEMCTCDVKSWLAHNDLLLNDNKSEVTMTGTASQLHVAETIDTVTVTGTSLTVSTQLSLWASSSTLSLLSTDKFRQFVRPVIIT